MIDTSYPRTYAVTPSDSVAQPGQAFMIGGVGNVAITDIYGTVTTITAPAVGVLHHVAFLKIMATGTTATSIVAFN
jgi:hypothetical protein